MESEEAVVVPLVASPAELGTEAMLRMVLNREALIISRSPVSTKAASTGLVAQNTGAFAKAIGQSVGLLGRAVPEEGLFRVIMPTGSVTRDLVSAVGGGYRGMVRTAGSTRISGHVRLIPAAAGTGATIAAGPLIATVGLAVAGDMLVQHQMNRKLDGIRKALLDIQVRAEEEERSILETAAHQSRKVAGYLLDQARIPTISSASHAFGDLDSLTNIHVNRLGHWLDVAEKYTTVDRVYAPELLTALVSKTEHPLQDFERMVAQTYEALALQARVIVLEKVAAEFSNPDRSLPYVEAALHRELSGIAEIQTQLVALLDDLSAMPLDSSRLPIPFADKNTLNIRTSFGQMVKALHSTPDGLPILTSSEQTILELAPGNSSMTVLPPENRP